MNTSVGYSVRRIPGSLPVLSAEVLLYLELRDGNGAVIEEAKWLLNLNNLYRMM